MQIGLLIITNGQNVRVAIRLHHQTTSVPNDVIDNDDVTINDVIDSWMNMHTLQVGQYGRVYVLGVNAALRTS